MKKVPVVLFLSLFLISFVSASLTDFIDRFNQDDIIYAALFVIFFALIFTVLKRLGLFSDRHGQPQAGLIGVISGGAAVLATFGIYKSGWSFEDFFYNIGFSADALTPFLWIVVIIVSLFLIWKIKVGGLLMVAGAALVLAALFTDMIYEKETGLITGIIIMVVGFLLFNWSRRRDKRREYERRILPFRIEEPRRRRRFGSY